MLNLSAPEPVVSLRVSEPKGMGEKQREGKEREEGKKARREDG